MVAIISTQTRDSVNSLSQFSDQFNQKWRSGLESGNYNFWIFQSSGPKALLSLWL